MTSHQAVLILSNCPITPSCRHPITPSCAHLITLSHLIKLSSYYHIILWHQADPILSYNSITLSCGIPITSFYHTKLSSSYHIILSQQAVPIFHIILLHQVVIRCDICAILLHFSSLSSRPVLSHYHIIKLSPFYHVILYHQAVPIISHQALPILLYFVTLSSYPNHIIQYY